MSLVSEKKVIFVIASDGFHHVEYNVPKDMLIKEGVTVFTASNREGGAIGKDGSTAVVDVKLENVDMNEYDGIFFIGGPGAMQHLDNDISYRIVNEAKKAGKAYGAICISTRILAKSNVLNGVKATGWDGDNALNTILTANGSEYKKHPIVTDDLVVTATGPESAKEFGEGILRVLRKKKLAKEDENS